MQPMPITDASRPQRLVSRTQQAPKVRPEIDTVGQLGAGGGIATQLDPLRVPHVLVDGSAQQASGNMTPGAFARAQKTLPQSTPSGGGGGGGGGAGGGGGGGGGGVLPAAAEVPGLGAAPATGVGFAMLPAAPVLALCALPPAAAGLAGTARAPATPVVLPALGALLPAPWGVFGPTLTLGTLGSVVCVPPRPTPFEPLLLALSPLCVRAQALQPIIPAIHRPTQPLFRMMPPPAANLARFV